MQIAILRIQSTTIKDETENCLVLARQLKMAKQELRLLVPEGIQIKFDCQLPITYLKGGGVTMSPRRDSLTRIWQNWQIKHQLAGLLDDAYVKLRSGLGDALIIPLPHWSALKAVSESQLQLADKTVLFTMTEVSDKEAAAFSKLVGYLERFRNIRIGLVKTNQKLEKLTTKSTLCFLEADPKEWLPLLQDKRVNKRKYIGWQYHANELRQKVKFNKDLFRHWLKARRQQRPIYNYPVPLPKVIHYCWFGGQDYPPLVQKCMVSWKKVLPEYEFKCWNEQNFPFEQYPFAKEALKLKKWAFISDVARLHALYNEGGIYLDTDIEILKPLDIFLDNEGFTSYESLNLLATGLMGFKKHHPWLKLMLAWYEGIHCDEDYTEIANTKVVSKITKWQYGVKLNGQEQVLPDGLHIYPREYFSPELVGKKWQVTDKTYCIHHFTGMW